MVGPRSASRSPGYFSDASVIRRVMRERATALSSQRALLMQAAHPLAVAGLLAHSGSLNDPYVRLARTAQALSTITFGTRAEADRIARRVRAMHRRVRGRLAETVGIYPAGTPYRADDPALLLWILYTLVDSAAVVYRSYVGRLSEDERTELWEDYRVIGRLLGCGDQALPPTLADLDAYGSAMLGGQELHVGAWARRRAREIVLQPPVPPLAQPVLQTVNFITIALLPDRIRAEYGFSPVPPAALRKALVGAGALYIRRGLLPVLPGQLREVPAARRAA